VCVCVCCALVAVNNNLYKMQGTNINILIRLLCKFFSLWNECYLCSVTSAAHIQVHVQIKASDSSAVSKRTIIETFHLILSLVTSLHARAARELQFIPISADSKFSAQRS
jgi:hypothetical protein